MILTFLSDVVSLQMRNSSHYLQIILHFLPRISGVAFVSLQNRSAISFSLRASNRFSHSYLKGVSIPLLLKFKNGSLSW